MPDLTRTQRARLRIITAATIAGVPLDPRRIGGLDSDDSRLLHLGLIKRRGGDVNGRLYATPEGHNALRAATPEEAQDAG